MNKCKLIIFSFIAFLLVSINGYAAFDVDKDSSTLIAPQFQDPQAVDAKSRGCLSCHIETDSQSMHQTEAVPLGCVDCHGGNADEFKPENSADKDLEYQLSMNKAHVIPTLPNEWNYPSSANPKHSFTLLNRESPEYIRFVNPSDYRIVRESCGACHMKIIEASERSLMATGAMLWGGAAYNNGIVPYKRYFMGESYTREGLPKKLVNPHEPDENMIAKGIVPALIPLPRWENMPQGDVFRVFEAGGRNITNLFPETGLPNALGLIQRLEEPGRPDIKQSNRGSGTGGRISVPVLNIHKTRLNDPFTWFLGTNDQPGDYRTSGCGSCHVVYANDRDPKHSGPYAKAGHSGKTQTIDPTISKNESGHPIKHQFTRAIPTSQCMICHMHQPNIFVNSFMGYTMWDYESDAPHMWPEKQRYLNSDQVRAGANPDPEQILSHAEVRKINERNPEEAAARGKWKDLEFVKNVSDLNPKLKDTQFADYHGHGWNFRAVFKRDRKGTLLDASGNEVSDTDPEKFNKAVHLSSIHMDVGMHCVDCHFAQDSHGNGHLYGEVAAAIEVDCIDCHGTADAYPNLRTSGPAAAIGGTDLSTLRNQDGKLRFEWRGNKLYQRSALFSDKEWELSLVKDTVNPAHTTYNAKAARAKLVSKNSETLAWGTDVAPEDRAHKNENMTCFTCHSSWVTSCAGCHLPIQANWKTDTLHYEGGEARNYATYNPQVVRDQMFQIGRHGQVKGNRIVPVRSSSALILSSRNANRELIYIQQPPVSSSGFSAQAFAPNFPHTTRKTETKQCEDCHLSAENDNNAIMAQLLLQGTNFVNFVGYNAYVGTESGISAIQVTEWEEPQAVIGSYLHKYAYPDWYKDHQNNKQVLKRVHSHSSDVASCLQLRGEYLYVAEGSGGFRVYDVASIANKGISQRIITAPFSPLGHDTHISSKNATCMALPTNQPIHPQRRYESNYGLSAEAMSKLMNETNQEQDFHPIYNYAFIVDAEEGLILTDVNTLSDGKARNNFLTRALTWNGDNILKGAKHITLGGYYAYITADVGLIIINLDSPLSPKVAAVIPLNNAKSTALQFRYLFVTDADGFKVIDVTTPEKAKLISGVSVALTDANRIYVARTYAYVAAGSQGLAIINVEKPESPKLLQLFTANGQLNDARDVIVASTNASLIGYVADGKNGLKVLQLTSPDSQPKFYGFSPEPKPELIASYPTSNIALALSKGLDRDRAVDETGGQIAVFGRIGSRPFTQQEMHKMYLKKDGTPWFTSNKVK